MMIHGLRLAALAVALLMVLVMACGGGDDESGGYLQESFGLQARGESGPSGAPGLMATAGLMAMTMAVTEKEVIREVPVESWWSTQEVVKEVEVPGETVVVERPVELVRSQAAAAPLSDPDLYTKGRPRASFDDSTTGRPRRSPSAGSSCAPPTWPWWSMTFRGPSTM